MAIHCFPKNNSIKETEKYYFTWILEIVVIRDEMHNGTDEL